MDACDIISIDMKSKLDGKIIGIGIVILALIIVAALFVVNLLNQSFKTTDSPRPVQSQSPQTTMVSGPLDAPDSENDGLTIEFMDSRYYHGENVDFDFYVVTLRVTTTNGINIDLDHFTTSEGINLAKTQQYSTQLESNQFYLGKANVVYQLVSVENTALFNIFVPTTTSSSITLSCDLLPDLSIQLDPTHNISDIHDLFYGANDVISDGRTYQLTVSETFTLAGDELVQTIGNETYTYAVPSTISVFAFRLDAVSLFGDEVIIESAQYIADDGQVFDALGKDITAEQYPNIIGMTITDKSYGYLFFEAYSNYNNPVSYSGQLHLKLASHADQISVKVDLNA